MTERATRPGPLSHLRILDLTQFLSGPFGTQILGDLGAEVIKIEAPAGDMTRRLPPHFVADDSAYYLSINRNKHSVAIDMKSQRGQTIVRDLALASDVVLENYRPGVLAKLGLDYETIAAEKPSIVWASISGFGQDGPYRDRPAYDMIVQALSGGMSLTGEVEGQPVRSGIPIGDLAAGLYADIAILAALASVQRTGRGECIDVAMLDCQVAMLVYQAAYYLASNEAPKRQGTGHDSIPTYRSFTCKGDTYLVITANTERMWQQLCTALGRKELASDERFTDNAARYTNRYELWPILEAAFLERDATQWADRLVAAEVPAAVVNTLDRALNDEQVLHRQMVLDLAGGSGERVKVAGNPIKFLGRDDYHTYPPRLGESAREILTRILGLSTADIDDLEAAGTITEAKPT